MPDKPPKIDARLLKPLLKCVDFQNLPKVPNANSFSIGTVKFSVVNAAMEIKIMPLKDITNSPLPGLPNPIHFLKVIIFPEFPSGPGSLEVTFKNPVKWVELSAATWGKSTKATFYSSTNQVVGALETISGVTVKIITRVADDIKRVVVGPGWQQFLWKVCYWP